MLSLNKSKNILNSKFNELIIIIIILIIAEDRVIN